jgi:hypothetical protein
VNGVLSRFFGAGNNISTVLAVEAPYSSLRKLGNNIEQEGREGRVDSGDSITQILSEVHVKYHESVTNALEKLHEFVAEASQDRRRTRQLSQHRIPSSSATSPQAAVILFSTLDNRFDVVYLPNSEAHSASKTRATAAKKGHGQVRNR